MANVDVLHCQIVGALEGWSLGGACDHIRYVALLF